MITVIWSSNSILSLQDIYNFIAFNSVQDADFVLDTLFELGDSLNLFPEKFPVDPVFNKEDIRFCPKWNYRIVYRIEINRIYIIDVFSTQQNQKIFKL